MGLFIVFEGGEGGGKSSQARYIYGLLCQKGYRARMLREPGGTELGEQLRHLIALPRSALVARWKGGLGPPRQETQLVAKDLWLPITPLAETFLFTAARAQLVAEVLQPALAQDTVLLCERYTYSTLAYQGYGRGIDLDFLRQLNQVVTSGLKPHLVVLLDMEPAQGLGRKRRVPTGRDRFEEEELEFHRRVREGYLRLVGLGPHQWPRAEGYTEVTGEGSIPWLVIDAHLNRKRIGGIIWERIQPLLPPRAPRARRPKPGASAPLFPPLQESP